MAKANILIVEDERIVAEDIQTSLKELGYSVAGIVSSGEEALKKAAAEHPDLVLMDIMLKGEMNGTEAAEQIRSLYNIPIIYLTAYADENVLARAKITEPFGYIVKPFEDMELNSSIEIALYKHEMETQLRESETWLSTTLRSIGDAVIATDTNSRITFMNPVAESLTGWNQKEATGKPLTEVFNIINEQTRGSVESPVDTVIQKGVTVGLANHTILISKDGKEILINDSAAPIIDEKGNIIGIVLIFRDVTEKNRMMAELQNMQKLKSIGVLAGGIAHDFNNILLGVFGNISLAKEKLSKNHPGFTFLEDAEKSINRATHLTTQLLTFAKGGEPVKENINIGSLIEEVVRFDLSGSNVMPVFDLAENLWNADVDKGQIQQVFSNLTINANQAMPDGGHLYITMENTVISKEMIPTLDPGKFIKITIQDEGIGIDPKYLERIFEPYFSTKHTGSGLGLSIIYSIINKHQGHISVESKPGNGTRFTIYLPASELRQLSETKPAITEYSPQEKPLRVLVMDDEEINCQLLIRMLESYGNLTEATFDGNQAIEKYKQSIDAGKPFDVIIMDLIIPGGIGGKEAIKDILKINPEAVAIVTSGYSNDPILANHMEYGFKGFLSKPFTNDQLQKELNRVLIYRKIKKNTD